MIKTKTGYRMALFLERQTTIFTPVRLLISVLFVIEFRRAFLRPVRRVISGVNYYRLINRRKIDGEVISNSRGILDKTWIEQRTSKEFKKFF